MALAGFALTIPLVWWLDKLYLGFMLYTFVWGCFMFAWCVKLLAAFVRASLPSQDDRGKRGVVPRRAAVPRL